MNLHQAIHRTRIILILDENTNNITCQQDKS